MYGFLYPKKVALIGASENLNKIGGIVAQNLRKFRGHVYYVNPYRQKVFGSRCYPDVCSINEQIDLGIIALPADLSIRALEACGQASIRHVIVLAGGFSEVGTNGSNLEEELVTIAKKYGINVLGPNTFGVYNPAISLDTFFNPETHLARASLGKVAVVAQSGAVAGLSMDILAQANIGVHSIISLGNKAMVSEIDALEFLLTEGKVDSILLYLESFSNGKRLLTLMEELNDANKRVVFLKGGITPQGTKAARSHTGSLVKGTKDIKMLASLFKYAGTYTATTFFEAIDAIKMLDTLNRRDCKNIGIITNTGGLAVNLIDQLYMHTSIKVPSLPSTAAKQLRQELPSYTVVGNPIDLTGSATVDDYAVAIEIMASSKIYDILVVFVNFQIPTIDTKMVDLIAAYKDIIPIVCINTGGDIAEKYMHYFYDRKLLVYRTVDEAINGFKVIDFYNNSIEI